MSRNFDHVAVLMGGFSSERLISLDSGQAVAQGLRDAGYCVETVVLDDTRLTIPRGVEAVFVALHGRYGEDGGIQAELNRRGVPYTGSGVSASRLAFDKCLTKQVLDAHGIPTAPWRVLGPGRTQLPLPLPVVIKPPREGSSFGLEWVFEQTAWLPALERARQCSSELMVEAYLPGREWTVGILEARSLPVIEIHAPQGRYDLDAKYTPGRTRYGVVDATAEPMAASCARMALDVFNVLGARGFGRVDFRLSPVQSLSVLEVNTIPGFTPTSLLPKAAKAAGIGFEALCARIMESAACDPPDVRKAGDG